MKKLLTSLAAFTAMTAAASAADLPRRAAPPVFTPVPVFTWTGAYFGINAGYAFDASDSRRNGFLDTAGNPVAFPAGAPAGGIPVATVVGPLGQTVLFNQSDRDGFTGGGQIGYNYQFTPGSGVVVGIEADAQYLDFGGRRNNGINLTPVASFTPLNGNLSTLDFFGTVRGRIGLAFDRALFYGTGGFAYASGDDQRFTNGLVVNNRLGGNDGFRFGWAAGAGVEYALPTDSFLNFFRSSAVTLKLEGLYVNLERGRSNLSLVGATTAFGGVLPVYDTLNFSGRRDDSFAVVRAGLNYKFGSY